MSNNLRSDLISELSSKFPSDLVTELLDSYDRMLVQFRKGAWDETLWKSGKFVENVFRVLHFAVYSKKIGEVRSINEMAKDLENLPAEKAPESVRVLIPRIASALIYDPRSKKGAIHVKPVNPDYIDATLVANACDWVLAEMIRLYHTKETEAIQELISSIVTRKVPFVEWHEGKPFVTVSLGAEDEILLLLLDTKDGLSRTQIGSSMENTYTSGRVTQALHSLLQKRFIVQPSKNNYVITGPGEARITDAITPWSVGKQSRPANEK